MPLKANTVRILVVSTVSIGFSWPHTAQVGKAQINSFSKMLQGGQAQLCSQNQRTQTNKQRTQPLLGLKRH